MNTNTQTFNHSQRGAAAIEFALVFGILIALLFGIIEFGRLLFTINSAQEITRRAAREQVVNWVDKTNAVQRIAVLRSEGCSGSGTVNFPNACDSGTVNFPGSPDITNAKVRLSFYHTYADAVADTNPITYASGDDPRDNLLNCRLSPGEAGYNQCIKFVRATLANTDETKVPFRDIALFVPIGFVISPLMQNFLLPRSTVIMPAESLGMTVGS